MPADRPATPEAIGLDLRPACHGPPRASWNPPRSAPGTGPGTYLRGCGVVDDVPRDPLDRGAIVELYGLAELDEATWTSITDRWRPYRTWATVLLRVGWERARPGRSYRQPEA